MPWCALANIMWGGREHPLYQQLSDVMKMLLSRGRPYFRKIVLGKGHPADVSAGLVGNTILLAQPNTGQIQKQLPPPRDAFGDALTVVFTTAREDVAKAKPLQVSRSLYLRCAHIRQQVCYAFADVHISESAAEELLPEDGVPEIFVQEAVHMEEARFFEPSMDGPAKLRDPGSKEQDAGSAEEEEDEEAEGKQNHEGAAGSGDEQAPAASTEEGAAGSGDEHAPAASTEAGDSGPPVAEELIGLDEADLDDPLSKVLVLQSRLKALQKAGDNLVKRQLRHAALTENKEEDMVAINGQTEECRQHFIEMQSVIRQMKINGKDVWSAVDKDNAEALESATAQTTDGPSKPVIDEAAEFRDHVLQRDPETQMNIESNRSAVVHAMQDAPNHASSASADGPRVALNLKAGKHTGHGVILYRYTDHRAGRRLS